MVDSKSKLRGFLILALVCVLVLGFVVYWLRTPERRVVVWLNELPEFELSENGLPNGSIVQEERWLDGIFSRNAKAFDFEDWNGTGAKLPGASGILIDFWTRGDARADPADVIIAMEMLGPEAFIPQLLDAVGSPDDQVRDRAAHALFMSRDSHAIEPLLRVASSDPHVGIRGNTLLYLSQWEDVVVEQRLEPLIESALEHENESLQKCAMLATILLKKRGANDGFVSIFDGETLEGWHAVPKDSASDWTVRGGVIVGLGSADRLAYLVWEDEALTDFELELQYRLPGEGNTGVEVRSQPDQTGKRPFEGYHADLGHAGIGPNILGAWDFHFATREEYPCKRGTRLVIDEDGKTHSSSIPRALTVADIRPHQWNSVRIVARGNNFQFFINGKLSSEFTDNAKSGRLEHGAIGLQIHDKGMRAKFKDIRLKRLTPSPQHE